MEALAKIQQELKAPKNQHNKFGGYNYRSCEDILEAVKPLLAKHKCTLVIHDDICHVENVPQMVITDESTKPKTKSLCVGSVMFVQATAVIKCGDEVESVTAQAAIDINKAGMDYAQSFGASSSYARKYALNGLFLIDDTKDADATNKHGKEQPASVFKPKKFSDYKLAMEKAKDGNMVKDIAKAYNEEVQGGHWTEKEVEEAGRIYHARIDDFTQESK